MSVINAFIDPPPMSSPGDYSFAYTFPYGSQHEFKWKDNYSTPLNLLLMQETTFVDNNTLSLQYDTLACTVPSSPPFFLPSIEPPPKRKKELTLFCLFLFHFLVFDSRPHRNENLHLARQTVAEPIYQ